MVIDCDRCEVRGAACGDCVVGVLLGIPGMRSHRDEAAESDREAVPPGAAVVQLDAPERRALDVLADQGLVPRLRLVVAPSRRATTTSGPEGSARDAV